MAKKLNCSFYGVMTGFTGYLKKNLKTHNVKVPGKILNPQKLDKNTEVLGVFVDSPVTAEVIKALPKLKLIVTMSTGFDHIDLKVAKARKIPVCNVPTYGENTVAEHAIALMMCLSRVIFPSVQRVKQEGNYNFDNSLRGFDIKGKTIGVVGTGHIGQHLIKRLAGFEAQIIAYDPYPAKQLETDFNFRYVSSLNKLLSQSDIISLHVPLFKETYHMINKRNIKKVKKGAVIINTARGGLIDPSALVWALESEHIRGAGLDVLEEEQIEKDAKNIFYTEAKGRKITTKVNADEKLLEMSLMNNILIDHPNTIVTPHNAFNSSEAIQRILDVTIENINAFAEGKTQNEVIRKAK